MVLQFKSRIIAHLKERGTAGAMRSQLLRKWQCPVAELESALRPLVDAGEVLEWTTQPKLGRPCTYYHHKDFASELTREVEQASMPVEEPGSTQRTNPCKVCGAAIPTPDKGRPLSYCSLACRRAAHEGGITLSEFITPAADPRVFAEVATLLVMADLIMRGFRVGRELYRAGSHIIVLDETGACIVNVVPVGLSGTFPDPNEYESMAAVYRDGKIVYGGRNPIVQPVQETPDVESVETKGA